MGLAVLVARGPRDLRRDGTAYSAGTQVLWVSVAAVPARWCPTSIQTSMSVRSTPAARHSSMIFRYRAASHCSGAVFDQGGVLVAWDAGAVGVAVCEAIGGTWAGNSQQVVQQRIRWVGT